jgi:hypothetical protein
MFDEERRGLNKLDYFSEIRGKLQRASNAISKVFKFLCVSLAAR